MKVIVFQGSPRKNGDTATLIKPFISELVNKGLEVKTISLYDKKISHASNAINVKIDWVNTAVQSVMICTKYQMRF